MPPLGKCAHRISPAAAMVNDFEKKKKNTNKTQLLPGFLMVDQRKKAIDLKTLQGPSTHVLCTASPDPNPYAISQVEELSYILSYQT
jgi:hypothetical protein